MKLLDDLMAPGTRSFVNKYAKTPHDAMRLVAEDRLRNLVLAGDFWTAKEVGNKLLNLAVSNGLLESHKFVKELMAELGI